MAFQPDIIVTTPDSVSLVVEAKVTLPNLERTEEGLKQYMVGMQCPVGLLITPERMWLYRDSYTSRSPESVEFVGEFDLELLWQQPHRHRGSRLKGSCNSGLKTWPGN